MLPYCSHHFVSPFSPLLPGVWPILARLLHPCLLPIAVSKCMRVFGIEKLHISIGPSRYLHDSINEFAMYLIRWRAFLAQCQEDRPSLGSHQASTPSLLKYPLASNRVIPSIQSRHPLSDFASHFLGSPGNPRHYNVVDIGIDQFRRPKLGLTRTNVVHKRIEYLDLIAGLQPVTKNLAGGNDVVGKRSVSRTSIPGSQIC